MEKRLVKITHTVEVVVEAESLDEINDFLLEETPSSLLDKAGYPNCVSSYTEDIGESTDKKAAISLPI